MMQLDVLPYELTGDIFTLACTDGGRTGCSLSLVSKHIRDLSRPFRFHTVALRSGSAASMASFLAAFTQERERALDGARPLLRHLYIASPATSSYHWYPRYIHLPSQWPHFSPAWVGHAHALLALVASELETLVLVQCPSYFLCPEGVQTGFPGLRELTIVGARDIPGKGLPSPAGKDDVPLPLYPRLGRLNLVSPTISMFHWTKHAPNLTHLRIAGSSQQDYLDDDFRQILLRRSEGTRGSEGVRSRLVRVTWLTKTTGSSSTFAHLELLTVQVYDVVQSSVRSLRNPRSSEPAVRFTPLALTEVQRDAGDGGFVMEPTGNFLSINELEKTTFAGWMSRVEGGGGCWPVQPPGTEAGL